MLERWGTALFALMLVGVAFYGSQAGLQSWDARNRDVEIQHEATKARYKTQDSSTGGQQSEAAPEQGKEHPKNRDFLGPEWFLVYVSFALAVFTGGLFWAAAEPLRVARRVRSIVRGSISLYAAHQRLMIEASNAGEGSAKIDRISWRISESNDFVRRPYWRDDPSGEVVHAPERAKPIKVVPLEEASHFLDPMIVFRLDYIDVNRGTTASIEHAMRIRDEHTPEVAVFLDTPPDFLEDSFPVEIGAPT